MAIVGSQNPVKINAFEQTLQRLFADASIQVQGVSAPSLVSEQPMSEQETLQGAINRVAYCQANYQADFYVAMEGGVDKFDYGPATFAYVVIANSQHQQVGRSANLPIPQSVYHALQNGEELGPLMDKLFNTHNVKQKGGAIGLLTNGVETRTSAYLQALTLAMAPFLHSSRFK
ncbi:inosine/xanthosine triphosphatase [Aliiglaciecola litoralis]|uniref:Inosine/xanthosine triphosphatase n=2 Tax=Aliiglaciecola litoralis TaxID=582857 RepID=A0ABN1LQK0_9ALTE